VNFEVKVTPRAKKELFALPDKIIAAVEEALLELEINPYSGDYKKLNGDNHRRRIGNYRIVYEIDTGVKLVTVFRIRHRSKAYRKF